MEALIGFEVSTDTPDPKIMRQKVERESYKKMAKREIGKLNTSGICITD